MKKGFTLLELIVVIVILGILATLGFSQYTRIVEKVRMAEVIVNFGKMRTLANAYYLQNGTLSTITNADLGIGSDIPSSCVSTNYFSYWIAVQSSTDVVFLADRCTANGKSPQSSIGVYTPWIDYMPTNPSVSLVGCSNGAGSSSNIYPWCDPPR